MRSSPGTRQLPSLTSLADELNKFYAGYEAPSRDEMHIMTEHVARLMSQRLNTKKAAGLDNITGHVLKACANQLAVFTEIFTLSQCIIPRCFKQLSLFQSPQKNKSSCLNDYRSIALTSVVMKCFERLVQRFTTASLSASLSPLQFAYRSNRSTEDVINHLLHTAVAHLDTRKGNSV